MATLPQTIDEVPETEPASPILLRSLQPVNLLSFGPDTPPIELGPLNILIGANGSGKSNFIETVALQCKPAAEDSAEAESPASRDTAACRPTSALPES